MPPPSPPDEAARQEVLARYDLLDTAPEASFERITALAARLFAVPVALVTLIDGGRQWFKSCVGLDFGETARDDAFCAYTILGKTVLVVPDTHLDPRFQANPYVVGAPFARFYAGAPLVTADGFCLGSLCLLDTVPRTLDEAQCATLQDLAAIVVEAFEARRAAYQIASRRLATELEASERRQASVVASAFDGVIIFDRQGIVLEFNPAAEKMFGRPRADVLGRPMGEILIPPELRPNHRERLRRITAAADAGTLRARIEQWGWHADGHRFPAEIGAVRSPGMEPPQYVGFVRDITERKAAEAALRQQQEILEETGHIARVGGWEYEVATGHSTWTPEMYRIYDLEAGGPPALARILGWYLPESRIRLENALRAAIEFGTPYDLEVELATAKGNRKWMRTICRPVRADGQTVKLRGAIQDVTERKCAETSLKLFRSLVDNTADTIEVVDPATGRFLDVNDQGLRSLGYTREEYLTLTVGDVAPGLSGEAWTGRAARIRAEGMASGEGWHRRKDGTSFPIEYKSQWVRLDRDYIVASIRDTTGRKEAEDKLRLFRTLVDHSEDVFAVIDPATGRFLDVNDKGPAMLGYSREEYLQLRVQDIEPHLAEADWPEIMEEVRRTGFVSGEGQQRCKDGQFIPIEYRAKLVRLDREYLVACVSDITRRKQAQAASDEQEEQLRLYAEESPVSVAMFDHEMRYLVASHHWREQLGLGVQAVVGRSHYELFPTIPPHWKEVHRRCLAGAVEKCEEEQFVCADGRTLWIRWEVQPWRRADGTVGGVIIFSEDITARKIAEDERLAAEGRYRALFESAPDGILIADPDNYNLDVNPSVCQMLGYEPRELVGLHLRDMLAEERHSRIPAALEAMRSKEGFQAESVFRRKDGSPISVEVKGTQTPNGSFLAIIRDITERKEAQEALRRSEGRLQAVIEHMTEGLVIARLDGELLHWNPAALGMHGVSDFEESLARLRTNTSVLEFATPHGHVLPATEWPLARLLRREPLRDYELRLTKRTGDWQRVCRYNGAIVREPGGEELAFLTIQDITESTRVQSRLRRLIESNVQGVIFWNRSGAVLDANDAFLDLVGYTREELVAGRINWIEMTPPQHRESDQRVIAQLDATGACQPFEKEYRHKDGTPIPILMGAAVFEDNPEEGVCFMVDLTERKQLEAQFLRSQRMESIGTLAGGIAHDLNNALGPIITSLDLLEMHYSGDEDSQKLVSIIGSSARRGADMVKQVLSFARGVSGERQTVQLRYLVEEIADIVHDTFPKDIRVQTRVPNNLWLLTGDATQLHQVLLNLCVNARDAMPHGGSLTISADNLMLDAHYAGLSAEAKPGPYIVVRVEDTGTGIPPGILDKIFDPFFTTKELGKGTGLGLSTTVGIVKSHGGFVQVYSELGRGTQFKLYLPADTDSLDHGAKPSTVDAMPRGNGEWILVVDDEPAVRQITTQTLEAYGYRVVMAANGAEALAIYAPRLGEIAAAVIDMMMPVMDGPALMQVLAHMNPRLPMIAASGLSNNAQIAKAANLGVKHFLPKPYTAAALLTILKGILATGKPPGASGSECQ